MTTMIGVTPRDGVDEMAEREARRSAPPPREPAPSLGRWLRHERELRQVSIEEIAATTRIPIKTLQLLEEDRHDALPGDVFVRGFLKSYARAIGLSVELVLQRFEEFKTPKAEPSALPLNAALATPERGRRFGIAIALVILLILFTLALSIVLRPRHRDAPVELSQRSAHPALVVQV